MVTMVPSSLSPLASGPIEAFAMVHLRLILPVRNVLEAHQRVWPLTSWSVTWSVSDSKVVSLFRFDSWNKKGAMIWWLTQLILFWTQMLINSKVIFSSIVKCWTSIHLRHEARELLLLQNPCKTLSSAMSTWKFEVVWTAPEVLWGNEEGDGEHLPGGHPANHAHNPDPLGLQDACEEQVEHVGTCLPAIFQSCLFWISLGPLIPS